MSRLLTSLPVRVRSNVRSFWKNPDPADPKVLKQLHEKQANYQRDDDIPDFMRKGKTHFYITSFIGIICTIGTGLFIKDLIN